MDDGGPGDFIGHCLGLGTHRIVSYGCLPGLGTRSMCTMGHRLYGFNYDDYCWIATTLGGYGALPRVADATAVLTTHTTGKAIALVISLDGRNSRPRVRGSQPLWQPRWFIYWEWPWYLDLRGGLV